MNPEVSIVVPVYNPGKYLRLAIESVLRQDHQNWELVIVDDGSPEDVSYVADIDPRIRLLRQRNGGQARARNAGAAAAKGEFIAFLDQDDLWASGKLSAQVRAMRTHPNLSLVHTQFRFIDGDGSLGALGFERQQTYLEMLAGSGLCSASMVLMKASTFQELGGFDPLREPVEDTAFFLEVLRVGESLFLPDCFAYYRLHGENQSKNYQRSYRAMHCLLQSYARSKDKDVVRAARRGLSAYRKVYGAQAFDHLKSCWRRRDWFNSWRHLYFTSYNAPFLILEGLFNSIPKLLSRVCSILPTKQTFEHFLQRRQQNQALRALAMHYGRAYWRLPALLRRRIIWESSLSRLVDVERIVVGDPEEVEAIPICIKTPLPALSFRHRLAAQGFRSPAPSMTRLPKAWLVGRYASPFTSRGRLVLSAFRDEPRMLGLERHADLEAWIRTSAWKGISDPSPLEHVWCMVSRLQSNYFHWLVEWCGRLELIDAYRDQTGRNPDLVIPESGPSYIRESLSLLGFGPECWVSWAEDSPPRSVCDLLIPSFRGSTVAASPAAMRWLRRRFLAAAGAEIQHPHRKLYISRPCGGWRSVVNDEEVADYLRGEGFDIIEAHRMTLADQIRIFSQASLIVGLHGSGLTNVLFAPEAAVLELFGSYGDGVWFGMTGRLGQVYEAMVCQAVGDNVAVDLEALKQRLSDLSRRLSVVKQNLSPT